jgi:hypothetical protein
MLENEDLNAGVERRDRIPRQGNARRRRVAAVPAFRLRRDVPIHAPDIRRRRQRFNRKGMAAT